MSERGVQEQNKGAKEVGKGGGLRDSFQAEAVRLA